MYQFIGGALKDKKDRRDFKIAGVQSPVSLPYEFYLDDNFPVKKQYSRPSCTAQAQAVHKERQEQIQLSARYIMAKVKELEGNTDWGAYTRTPFQVVNKFGALPESRYPESPPEMSWVDYLKLPSVYDAEAIVHKSGSYWRVDANVEAIKQAIFQNKQSVVIAIPWFNSYNRTPESGALPAPDTNPQGHAVEVKGWEGNSLKVKNSFGSSWGDHGYFWYENSPQRRIWDSWQSSDEKRPFPVELRYGLNRTWADYTGEKSVAFNPWLIKKIGRLPNNLEINALWFGKWDFESVFKGKVKNQWLNITKMEYLKRFGILPE